MSFTVTIYEFQKRHNSTRRPEGASWDFNGLLREGSSLITPTISFEFATDFSPMSNSYGLKFNYAYVPKFARYYWITDWTYEGGLWHATMKVDVLASFRPEILASSAFVAYDESTNTDLVDSRMSMLTAKTIDSAVGMFSKLGQHDSGGGVIILMATGRSSTAAFAMTQSDISQLMDNIISYWTTELPIPPYPGDINQDPWYIILYNAIRMQIAGEIQDVINLFSNGSAADNLRSAIQLPLDISDIPGSTQVVWLGQYYSQVYGKKVSSRILYDTCQVQIPWRYTDWRMNEPYTEIFLYIPYVGNVKMPNSVLIGETDLRIYAYVDLISGDAIFQIYIEPSDKLIAVYTANIGACYPIGVSNVSASQTVTGIAGAVGSIAAGSASGGTVGAVTGALGAVQGIMAANTPTTSCVSSGGGGASQGLNGRCTVTVISHNTIPIPGDPDTTAIMGTPTMRVRPLGNITGYLETRGAAVTGNMTATEHAELNAMLDSGIYVELGG